MSIVIAAVASIAGFWLVLTLLCASTDTGDWRDRFIDAGFFAAKYTFGVAATIGLGFGLLALWGWAL